MIDGVTVATARKARGWSRRELAERSGVPESSLYTMERKGRSANPNEKVKLAAAFGWDYEGRPLTQPTDAPAVGEPEPPVKPEPEHFTPEAIAASVEIVEEINRRHPELVQRPIISALTAPTITPPGLENVVQIAAEHEQAAVREALLRPQPPDGPVAEEGVRLISHSELRAFKACRRRWWLEWHRGLRPKIESPFGVKAVGNRIHQALALYYTPGMVDSIDPATALELLIVRDWTALTERIGMATELQKQFDTEANLERAMVTGYVEWLANTGADADLEVIAPETYVEYTLHPHGQGSWKQVRLIGRLDVRVRRITDGSAMFIDHKTVANFVEPTRTLSLDEQMLHYHLLERRGNDLVVPRSDGALYNMLRRVKRTAGAKPPFYERVQVRHNDHEIDSYELRTIGTIDDVLRVEQALESLGEAVAGAVAYPRPSRECSWCPFFEVCPMFDDGSRAEDMIAARYQAGDPLDYYRQPAVTIDQGTEEG